MGIILFLKNVLCKDREKRKASSRIVIRGGGRRIVGWRVDEVNIRCAKSNTGLTTGVGKEEYVSRRRRGASEDSDALAERRERTGKTECGENGGGGPAHNNCGIEENVINFV
ncbi:MAG: hypothetical protein II951_13695 [Bacteroidales bacterium]|nr:hypothetical protein [Bacteroidales bacterium]